MPKYFEFVFSAYAIWIVVFGAYFTHLFLRTRRVKRALRALQDLPGETRARVGSRTGSR